jgi:hypothetical protein
MDEVPCASDGISLALWLIWGIELVGLLPLLVLARSRLRAIYNGLAFPHRYRDAIGVFWTRLLQDLRAPERMLFGSAALIYFVSLVLLPMIALGEASPPANCFAGSE